MLMNSCHCTIIPPHMSEMLIETHDDYVYRNWSENVCKQHKQIREKRALCLPNRKACDKEPIIRFFDAEFRPMLDGKRIWSTLKSGDEEVKEAFIWTTRTNEFYKSLFDRNSIDNQGMNIYSLVHYNMKYNNAFWTGRQIVFGDFNKKYFNRFTIDPGDDPQPKSMDAYVETRSDNGGVHINSGILNYAFYLSSINLFAINPEKYSQSFNP